MLDTIGNLADDYRAAIGLIFLAGGTIADAFAKLIATNPELTQLFLIGAKAETILAQVVCASITLQGAPVRVPRKLYDLLWKRISGEPKYSVIAFLSYRSDKDFCALALERDPSLFERLKWFSSPLGDDLDASFLARLYHFGLLPEEVRVEFVEIVHRLAVEEADASFLEDYDLRSVLRKDEIQLILNDVEANVLDNLSEHVSRVAREWDQNYPPDDQFEPLKKSIDIFARELGGGNAQKTIQVLNHTVRQKLELMFDSYAPPEIRHAPTPPAPAKESAMTLIFRDIDD